MIQKVPLTARACPSFYATGEQENFTAAVVLIELKQLEFCLISERSKRRVMCSECSKACERKFSIVLYDFLYSNDEAQCASKR